MKKIYALITCFFIVTSFNLMANTACKPVMFVGNEVLCLKNGLGVMKVEERVLLIEKRLNEVTQDLRMNPYDIAITEADGMLNVNLKDYYIVSLKDGDFDYPQGKTFEEAAKEVVGKIKSLIITQREVQGPENLIKGFIYTGIATLFFILILFIFSKIFPRISNFIEEKGKGIPSFKIQTWEVLSSARVIQFILWLNHALRIILTLAVFYIYIPMVLSFFPQTAPMAPYIFNFIADPLKQIFNTFLGFIPNLFFIIVVTFITTYSLKLIKFFFGEIEKGNIEFQGFYKDWAMPSYTLVRVLVIAFSLVVIFPYIPGSESSAFKGVSVFFGLLLSLGSSSSIANIIAGVVITYMRPFKIGDVVKISDTEGMVIERNLLVTRLRTIKNVDITVPNSMVLGAHILNYSSNANAEGLVLSAQISLGYDINWRLIHKLLIEAALRNEHILKTPAPFVWHKSLDDFYVSYELNVFISNVKIMGQVKSDLYQSIQDVFFENGVEILSPGYTALVDGSGPSLPKEYRK